MSEMKKNITLQDIANILSVSKVTVSKALRNHPDISELKKAQVRDCALKLGYIPNLMARNLSSKKTYTIGVVVPKVTGDFFPDIINQIYQTANDSGYEVILAVSQEDKDYEIKHIQTLLAMCVDGLLISITRETKDYQIFKVAKRRNVPIVFFDRVIKNDKKFSYVVSDDSLGVYNAMKHIVQAGYNKIAFVGGTLSTNIDKDRIQGFKKAIKDHGLFAKNIKVIKGGYEEVDGYIGMKKLSQLKKRKPEVIFCITYPVAMGVMRAAEELNIKVPSELDIISFGGSNYNHFIKPTLSYVKQPISKIGKMATFKLIDHIKDPNTRVEHIKVETKLVIRETCVQRSV